MTAYRSPFPIPRRRRPGLWLSLAALGVVLGACANLASVRTLGAGIKSVTDDTAAIIAADKAACAQSNIEIDEYNRIFVPLDATRVDAINCEARNRVLDRLLAENKAFQAYGAALSSLAQDQYVTTDNDGKAVAATLQSAGAQSAVVSAVSTVFTAVEGWALSGYRQHQIKQAITGPAADAFLTIAGDMKALRVQYRSVLLNEQARLGLIHQAVTDRHIVEQQRVAAIEMDVRIVGLSAALEDKLKALDAYEASVDKLPGALADAQKDVEHPDSKAIAAGVKAFASQAKDAHDKIAKAFPHAF